MKIILFSPLVAALIVRLLARQPRSAAAAGTVVVGGLWLWLRGVDVGDTTMILWGQPLLLTAVTQNMLLLLLAGFTILFTLSTIFDSGDWFVPAGLVGFSFLAGSLLVRPFSVAILLFFLAAGVLTLTVQSGQAGSVRGSFRHLLGMLLAVSLLLVVWQLKAQADTWQLSGLLALACLLLLAGFPFHIWLQAVVNETRPLPLVLMVGLVPIVPLTLLFHLFAGHPTLLDASFRQFIWLSGSLTLLVAGVLAITAVHLKRFIGGVLLLDMSLTILCLTLPQDVAWKTAVTLQISRFGGLLLLAAGWELLQRDRLRQNLPDWPLDKLPLGLGRQVPAALALFGLGLFSLLGLPFTLGFGGHWRLLTAVGNLANQGNLPWWLPALTLLSLGLGAAAVWRVLGTLLQKPAEENEAPTMYNPLWLNVMVGLAFLLALWLALFPTAIINLVTSVLQISQNLS